MKDGNKKKSTGRDTGRRKDRGKKGRGKRENTAFQSEKPSTWSGEYIKKKNHSLLAFESQEEHFSCLNHEPKGSVMVSEIGGCQNLSLVLMR